eukprot:374441-Amphidinium_carterae.1
MKLYDNKLATTLKGDTLLITQTSEKRENHFQKHPNETQPNKDGSWSPMHITCTVEISVIISFDALFYGSPMVMAVRGRARRMVVLNAIKASTAVSTDTLKPTGV